MPNEDELTPAERELEAAMTRLRPARPALTANHVLATTLVARARRTTRIWQAVAAALAVAVTVAITMAARPPREVERIVYRDRAPTETAETTPAPPARLAYLEMRAAVLAEGAGALEQAAPPSRDGADIRVRTAHGAWEF